MVAEFDRRRKVVIEGLNRLPGVSCATPKGAFYAFPNIKRTGWKGKALASSLLEEAGVAIIGGPDFGVLGEGYVRISYANSIENIGKALDRMDKLQYLLYADANQSLLVVLQALDAAGKDGVVRHVLRGMNPQGTSVFGFKQPSKEEAAHDFLWRAHQRAPGKGEVAIFNRS